jgi:RNA polymerase primary sigma factor
MGRVGVIAAESGLQVYLKQINTAPLLTAEDEQQLATIIQRAAELAEKLSDGNITAADLIEKERLESEAAEARDRMIKSNLRLVVNIAKKYGRRGVALSDLIEEGNLGLMRAVDGFDPERDVRFSTYAAWWIKQAIKRSLINTAQPIHIPAYMVEMIAKWRQSRDRFMEREGRQPSIEELSKEMELPERKVRIIRRAVKALSSSGQDADADSGAALSEILTDDRTPAPDEAIFTEADSSLIHRLLDEITDREAAILRLRFGLDNGEAMTLKAIGEKVELTRERVRQIEREALKKLSTLIQEFET